MEIVGGLDLHRAQITFDYLELETGEVTTGRIVPADRDHFREWLGRQPFEGRQVAFAVEGCTGWRYVVEELERAGIEAHLAEPADTAAARGKKRRAKTDKADARHLRQLLVDGRVPESWVPPGHVLEVRVLGRLYMDLMEERRSWQQRVRAHLFHQGVPAGLSVFGADGREVLEGLVLSTSPRQAIETALDLIDGLAARIVPLRAQLGAFARRQPGYNYN